MKPNGCGSSSFLLMWARIPFGLFKRCCNSHDIHYQVGYDKDVADDCMLDCMYRNAIQSKKMVWIKLKIADMAYAAVTSRFGDYAYKKQK